MSPRLINSIILAVSVLLFFILVLPGYDRTMALLEAIEEREDILQETQQILGQIDSLSRSINERRSEVERLDRLLPKEKEMPELLASIESIVSASGLNLSELTFSELSTQAEVKKLIGSAKLTGNFASFVTFLDLLEKNLRLVDVVSFDISPQSVGGGRLINYDVRFEVGFLGVE